MLNERLIDPFGAHKSWLPGGCHRTPRPRARDVLTTSSGQS